MSTDSLHFAGVVLITVPAIAFGGARLLTMIFRREPGYLDNPVRQNLWRAGHAHAGVLVILTLTMGVPAVCGMTERKKGPLATRQAPGDRNLSTRTARVSLDGV